MRILTIEDNVFPDPEDVEAFRNGQVLRDGVMQRWPKELRDLYEQADIVLYMFAPYSHLILKGPEGLVVDDVRDGLDGFRRLQGSTDPETCAKENKRLIGSERRKALLR